MRVARACLGVLFLLCAAGLAQEQERPSLGKEAPQERPTLGKDGSTPNGPRTSTTNDPRRLASVKTLYIDHIDNALSDKLTEGLARMGRFKIVASRQEADTVMSGTCFDSRRLKTVHSEVFLHDRTSGASIWQDVVRHPYNPPPLDKAVDDTATVILAHLGESIQEAERK
ncbi:MAG TPA: hypothetical protein VKU44_01820 [Terriglobia bacterium]|nr:hypothetical protein [Terriglobia bacterium]